MSAGRGALSAWGLRLVAIDPGLTQAKHALRMGLSVALAQALGMALLGVTGAFAALAALFITLASSGLSERQHRQTVALATVLGVPALALGSLAGEATWSFVAASAAMGFVCPAAAHFGPVWGKIGFIAFMVYAVAHMVPSALLDVGVAAVLMGGGAVYLVQFVLWPSPPEALLAVALRDSLRLMAMRLGVGLEHRVRAPLHLKQGQEALLPQIRMNLAKTGRPPDPRWERVVAAHDGVMEAMVLLMPMVTGIGGPPAEPAFRAAVDGLAEAIRQGALTMAEALALGRPPAAFDAVAKASGPLAALARSESPAGRRLPTAALSAAAARAEAAFADLGAALADVPRPQP